MSASRGANEMAKANKSKQRRNARKKNGIKISEVGSRRHLEVDFTVSVAGERVRFRRFSPFETRAQTYQWAEAERDAILERAGRAPSSSPRADPGAPRTVKYWARRWLEDAATPARRDGKNRRATIESKETIARVHLLPHFGRRMVTKIDADSIDAYVHAKIVDESLAETTVALHLRHLRSLLNLARRKGTKVERSIELPENITMRRPRRSQIPMTLSGSQTRALLDSIAGDARLHLFALLLFRQGCRVGEVQALRWSDIDLRQATMNIHQSWSRYEFGDTKGGRPRLIPLHHETHAALEEWGPADEPWSLLFPSPRSPERPRGYARMVDKLRAHVAELDLRDERGRPLHLTSKIGRHSLGRHWAEQALPLRSLQELLGHCNLDVTEVYMHWSSGETAKHLNRIGEPEALSMGELLERLRRVGVDEITLSRAGLLHS